MYTRENIVALAAKTLDQITDIYTIKDFLCKFHKLSPYPSTSTLYHRFGNINKLIDEALVWKENNDGKKEN